MQTKITFFRERNRKINGSFLFVLLVTLFFTSCTKEIAFREDAFSTQDFMKPNSGTTNINNVSNFHVSASKLVLLQDNASLQAISFSWNAIAGKGIQYTVEAAVRGTSFEEPVTLGSTDDASLGFCVQKFNSLICQILYANNTGMVDIRVKANWPELNKNALYSDAVALEVTTYQNYTDYDDPNVFRLPGNYQNWKLATAPKVVPTAIAGEYEGYINFTNQYPQILMVKGSQWETKNTYTNIGDNKFGFGGSMISVFGGAGVYLFRASSNTNKWSYTKINSWDLNGTAVPAINGADPVMTGEAASVSWSITTNLAKGSFRFRANNNNAISFGHKNSDDPGVPSYEGDNIVITSPGNYTIKLQLLLAGNYLYSIQKNRN